MSPTVSWPLLGTFKVKLLNQLEDKNHYAKSLKFTDNDCHPRLGSVSCPKFIEQLELELNPFENIQYLKDDTLYFKVSLKSGVHYKHWLD